MCADDPFRESVVAAIRSCGVDETQVEPLADSVTRAIRDEYHGERIYVSSVHRESRNVQVLKAHRQGMPRDEICRRWRISKRTFYRIVELVGR